MILFLSACATPSPTTFELFQGEADGSPELRDDAERLDIFLKQEGGPTIYCIALNEESRPLPEVHERISASPPGKPILLYGERIDADGMGFWWGGVDCRAVAVVVWHVRARKYVFYDLRFRESLMQWKFVRALMMSAAEKAANGVVPIPGR